MFERFSKPARRVVKDAVTEAELRDDPRIGSEHLLIALAWAELAIDRATLGPLDVSPHELRRVLAGIDTEALAAMGVAVESDPDGPVAAWPVRRRHRPFTHSARDTLEAALAEAIRLDTRRITPEVLLLGVLRVPATDPAARMMDRLGVDRGALHAAVATALRKSA